MDNKQLCTLCRGLNIESLTQTMGYQHAETREDLRKSAENCPMCKLLEESLREKQEEPLAKRGFVCRFYWSKHGKAALKVNSSSNYHGFLRVYTAEVDDPAVDTGVEVKFSPSSPTADELTFPLAESLIRACFESHKCGDPFRRPAKLSEQRTLQEGSQGLPALEQDQLPKTILDTLPTRLVDLTAYGEDSLDARLIDVPANSKPPGEQGFYASLSYCWGPDTQNMYTTTSKNLQSRKERILWKDLPPTFQDAFRITRNLGIPYLWIDAICIIQDSIADWEYESAKMGGIYATGAVTISADASDSVNGGILNLATTANEETQGLVKVTSILRSGKESSLFFYIVHSTAPGTASTPPAILGSPLSKRAWCMQERMLSSRILHFTKQGFIWECRDRYASLQMISFLDEESICRTLAGALRILEQGLSGDGWGYKVPTLDTASLTDDQLTVLNAAFESGHQKMWQSARDDGNRKMGDQWQLVSWWNKNVVASYSGRRVTFTTDRLPAISGMARLFAEHIQSPYLAGLWLADIEEGLEWRRAGETYQSEKSDDPSFSWISHPGPVDWPCTMHMHPYGKAFDIINYHVELSGLDPYGKISSAELILHGHLRLADMSPTGNDVDLPHKVKRRLLDDTGNEIGEVDLDLDEVKGAAYYFLLYKDSFGFLRLLLLVNAGKNTTDEYKRIGIGKIRPRHAHWLEETEEQTIRLT